jgi:hypothetical protein
VVLAGSQTALSFWQERGGMSFSKALVVPLGRVIMDQEPIETNLSEPIRVGFLGFPIFHKGWHSFENLAARHYGDRRYTFHHLGQVRGELARNIQFVETAVSRPEPEAMIEAIVNLDLDVVVNWSLCYETFSYVTHEALAAGTFVVTRREAGNVWPAILRVGLDRGCALDTDDELFELFETGRIITMLTDKRYGRFERSGITASYLLEDHR